MFGKLYALFNALQTHSCTVSQLRLEVLVVSLSSSLKLPTAFDKLPNL